MLAGYQVGERGLTASADEPLNGIVGQVRTAANRSAPRRPGSPAAAKTRRAAPSRRSRRGEAASSMEELTSAVKQNPDNAHQAGLLARAAAGAAVCGGKVVGRAIETMSGIVDSVQHVTGIMADISADSLELKRRPRAGHSGHHPDGRRHPAERRAGRESVRRRAAQAHQASEPVGLVAAFNTRRGARREAGSRPTRLPTPGQVRPAGRVRARKRTRR